jgi:Flagellar transcriptional activator (FlhD)
MSTLEQDLAQLNFEYLMLARECARSNPLEAAWRFGVDRKQIEEIAEFSLEKIREISAVTRTVIRLVPMKTPNDISLASHGALLIQSNADKENM